MKSLLSILACLMFLQTGLVLAMEEQPTPDQLGREIYDLIRSNLSEDILAQVASLIKRGANVNVHIAEYDGNTILLKASGNSHYALKRERMELQPALVNMLIAAGADVNATNNDKITPLFKAVGLGPNPQVITILIESGATIKAPYNWQMKNPLDIAVENARAVPSDDHPNKRILKAMVTTLSPSEVQHILPMVMALKFRIPEQIGTPIPADVQRLLRNIFVEQVVNEKLAFAKMVLPNEREAELRTLIEQSILRVLRKPTTKQ